MTTRYALAVAVVVLMAVIHGAVRAVTGGDFDSAVANVVMFWAWPFAAGCLYVWASMSEAR